ncbi:hypothetical protein IAG44_38900 [Streptomyces roseirectus]|uniref:HTH luxR-type domain-containing protein n=1 Tax=Streptomyces roseirectus TaxID=2768066 RepID=A0A7H0IPW7_9ACTN|nr:helix-turn-helix transcriptional regulator [Streptomyces roseirectus]QNP74833.1 hypothetical protein IAG44_38900 [Streptomyces roseirectus]
MAGVVALLDDEDTSVELIAEVTRLAPEFVNSTLTLLTHDGLIRHGRFDDPAARSAVLASLHSVWYRVLRLRVAEALYERGEPDGVVAAHLLRAGGGDDTDLPWAAAVLERAAEAALGEDDLELAVAYLRRAQMFHLDAVPKSRLRAKLADTEWSRNPERTLRHLPELMDRARQGDIAPLGLTMLVKQLLWHGRTAEATELTVRLRSTADDGSDYQRFAMSWIATTYPGVIRPAGLPSAAPPLGTAGRMVSGARTLAEVLTRGGHDRAVTEAGQLLETIHPRLRNRTAFGTALVALDVLTYSDELSRATVWSGRLLEAVAASECATLRALLQSSAALLALRRGELATAADLAERSFEGLSPAGWGALIGAPLSVRVAAATAVGDHTAAAYHLAQPVPDALFETRYGVHYLAARGGHLLAVGRADEALADYLLCGELMAAWGMDVPGLEAWRLGAARAWLRKGNVTAARRLVADQLTRLGNSDARTRGAALRQLAAVSRPEQRRQILHEAIELLEQCGDRLELAYAIADLSLVESQLRRHRRSWALHHKAAKLARDCGATGLYEKLTSTPRTVVPAPVAHPAMATLTTGERRVVALAAQDYTNPEIARKLHITRSTVEQHLTHAYRKLGISRRDELPTEITGVADLV